MMFDWIDTTEDKFPARDQVVAVLMSNFGYPLFAIYDGCQYDVMGFEGMGHVAYWSALPQTKTQSNRKETVDYLLSQRVPFIMVFPRAT